MKFQKTCKLGGLNDVFRRDSPLARKDINGWRVCVSGELFVCATLPTDMGDDKGARRRVGGRPAAGDRSTAVDAAGDDRGARRRDGAPRWGDNTSTVAAADLLVTMYGLDRIQSLASLVAVLVSMTGLLVCLVVYLLFPALRRPTSGRCLICLIVCLLAGQLLYLAGALHGFDALGFVGGSSAQAEMCYWLAVVTHYVLLAGAFWLNVMAMDAARNASSDTQVSSTSTRASRYAGCVQRKA